jgi:chromosome partitioning protein
MRKIAILGFKGGIGKTTTCVNLGAALALKGYRVLLIDTDTQANLAISLGVTDFKSSLADVLTRKAAAEESIVQARRNLFLLPSSMALFKVQQRMVLEMAREEMFQELFAGLDGYDYLLLDCAPSLSILNINAIAYAEEVFIPVSMEMLAMAGARQFMEYLSIVNRTLGGSASIRLIIPTMYDPRRRVSKEVIRLLMQLGPRVTRPIRIDTLLSEAPGQGNTIFEYAPRSRGAMDYAQLTETVAKMRPLAPKTGRVIPPIVRDQRPDRPAQA